MALWELSDETLARIESALKDIRDDIRELKERGTNCDQGIVVNTRLDPYGRALLVHALKQNEGAYAAALQNIVDPKELSINLSEYPGYANT